MYIHSSIKNYLDELSSEQPIPGGGGTSALAGALGIGLELMVARISLKRATLEARSRRSLKQTVKLLEKLRRNAQDAIDLDPKMYAEVMRRSKALKTSGNSQKAQANAQRALVDSFRLQADLALLILMAKELLAAVDRFAKGSIRNDLIVAGGLLDGAFCGALATARINVVYLKPGLERRHCERALARVEQRHRRIKFE